DLIATAPSVIYRVAMTDGSELEIHNPSELPTSDRIESVYEPYVKLTDYTPEEYVGPIMQLLQEKRGKMGNMHYIGGMRTAHSDAVA
ncbi:elongation factor 4, partial [Escherichia coli]|nr:elongation factor 4 [Escherichia coli]